MPEEKKIIIDEDWKSQVQAEKEHAKRRTGAEEKGQASTPFDADDVEMPPASLEMLLTTLATEALVALGQVPHPATQKMHVHRSHAKYLIDTIEVLQQKTKGNLTPAEQDLIDNLLHQLRMVYIESGTQPQRSASTVSPD